MRTFRGKRKKWWGEKGYCSFLVDVAARGSLSDGAGT